MCVCACKQDKTPTRCLETIPNGCVNFETHHTCGMEATFQLAVAAQSFTAAQNSVRNDALPESLLHTHTRSTAQQKLLLR